MGGIDYIAEYNVICLQKFGLEPNFFEFDDYVILWDGEISDYDNSTCYIMRLIGDISHCGGSVEAVIKICSQFRGAFAFILVQKSKNLLFFGRDIIGQHSLVCNLDLTYLGSLCSSNVCATSIYK